MTQQVVDSLDGATQLEPIGGFWSEPRNLSEDVARNQAPGSQLTSPYVDGDEQRLLRELPEEMLARVQDTLVALGLAPSVIPGEMDEGTIVGFTRLLAMANRNGERWSQTVSRLQQAIDRGEIDDLTPTDPVDPGYIERTFLPPDPAEIRNSIRDMATQIVPDVDLSDDEVDFLRGQFEQFGRQQFNAEEQQRREMWDAENRAVETGEDQTVGRFSQNANAAERFREFFNERYAANLDRRESAEEEVERREVTGGNLSALLAFATGRGGA